MKQFLTVSLIFSFLIFGFQSKNSLALAEDKKLPSEDGFCGLCDFDAQVGSKCECTLEEWKKAGFTTGRCSRNTLDVTSPIFICKEESVE